MRRRKPEPVHVNQPSDVTRGIPGGSNIVTEKTNSSQGKNSMHDRAINNDKPFLPDTIRFLIIQNLSRKRDCSSGNTRNMCRQDNNSISQVYLQVIKE